MRAIILAAGQGTRLREYTRDRPKCLVKLGSKPLLVYQCEALHSAGVHEITVVTGYSADRIRDLGCRTVHNDQFANTNMVASLMCAAELFDGSDDVLIAYGDIVYEASIVRSIVDCQEPISTTVDVEWLRLWQLRMQDPLEDAETLKLDPSGDLRELGKRPRTLDDVEGQYMGLIKVRAGLAPRIVSYYHRLEEEARAGATDPSTMFMTDFLQRLIDDGHPVRAVPVSGGWLAVDTVADLEMYEQLLEENRLDEFWQPEAVHST